MISIPPVINQEKENNLILNLILQTNQGLIVNKARDFILKKQKLIPSKTKLINLRISKRLKERKSHKNKKMRIKH